MEAFAAFLATALLVVATAQAADVPSLHSCEISALTVETDFVQRALGGHASCVDAEDKAPCCKELEGLFASGGVAEFCMCNSKFFSAIMLGLPGAKGVDPTKYRDMLVTCGIPVTGKSPCPGADANGEVEPQVQSQAILSKVISRLLGGGSSPPPSPPPPKKSPSPSIPPPLPRLPASAGGKKGTKFVTMTGAAPTTPTVFMPAAMPAAVPFTVPATTSIPAPIPTSIPAPTQAPIPAPIPAPTPAPTPAPIPAPAPAPVPSGSFSGFSG